MNVVPLACCVAPFIRCMTFADCRLQTADRRPQTADRRPQTADCRLQTADCRLQTADCRPQIADCKLKDTKNLPNKGDNMKNITSCESEKVAKLSSFPRCSGAPNEDIVQNHLTQHC